MSAPYRPKPNTAGNPYDTKTRTLGRPVKVTPEHGTLARKFIVEDGAMLSMLPGLMKVPARTFYDWMKRGNLEESRLQKLALEWPNMDAEARAEARKVARKEKPFLDFSQAVHNAIQERDTLLLGIIKRAANGAPKIVVKVKKELRTANVGSDEDPILDRTLIETERTETRTVEYDWRAAQYLLEKGQPQTFGPRATIDIKKALPDDPAALAEMELPELLALASKIESALDGSGGMDEG